MDVSRYRVEAGQHEVDARRCINFKIDKQKLELLRF